MPQRALQLRPARPKALQSRSTARSGVGLSSAAGSTSTIPRPETAGHRRHQDSGTRRSTGVGCHKSGLHRWPAV